MTPCINSENYQLRREIRDYATAYCTFEEVTNGRIGTFPDELIDKTIACFEKVLYNRLFIQDVCNEKPRSFVENLEMATQILDGTYKEDRLHSVIKRLYVG